MQCICYGSEILQGPLNLGVTRYPDEVVISHSEGSMSRKSSSHQNHSNGLGGQDSVLAMLLEHALKVKEEVAGGPQSTLQALENHIHTIAHIVQQLSINMQACTQTLMVYAMESHLAQRHSVASETSLAVQNLDQKSAAGIGDLRGRVARCDASIAQLSADVISGGVKVRRLQQEVTELRSTLDVQLKRMETKLCQAIDKAETSLSEKVKQQKTSMSDLQRQVQRIETRHLAGLEEAAGNTARLRRWTEEQLQASSQTHTQDHLRLQSLLQDKLLDAESKSKEPMRALEARVGRVEVQQEQFLHRTQADQQKCPESKRIRSLESSLQKELQQLKQETHSGEHIETQDSFVMVPWLQRFKYVHDAIELLRRIGDPMSRHRKDALGQDTSPTGTGR
ncbi:Protein FAM81B [Merluccius polli]|uniref:Protein FAM81B n=1 Tax=Merluccius polli TaxID=89951 RepID=A0AA47NZK2_MERPO|nr:Protein FAM81B [Merluccius polli]